MNLFGSKDTGLPMHGGARRNNGVSGVPVVNKKASFTASFIITIQDFDTFPQPIFCRLHYQSYGQCCRSLL